MIFQRLNRTDPERIFVVVQANEALAADDACQWELASASIDGIKVRQPDTGNLYAFVGVADAAIAANAYGLVQIYGFRSSARVGFSASYASWDTGMALVPVAGQVYLQSVATVLTSTDNFTRNPIVACLGESIASASASSTVSRKIFIRAM